MSAERPKRILVAGVGNAWMRDDGFGGEVARRLQGGELPEGVEVMDVGSGGLDLAYEVMRGYHALLLVDASRQGGPPGTLYVMEVKEADVEAGIEDGAMLDPHDMSPQSMLRFVRSTGGWPGKVMIVACEPEDADEAGFGLTPTVAAAVPAAVDLVLETVAELGTDAAYAGADRPPAGQGRPPAGQG